MGNIKPEEVKYIGYSNGKTYPLYAMKDGNIGLCDIEGWVWPKWCLFEKIESVEDKHNTQPPKPLNP
jgi:hypothetical protein